MRVTHATLMAQALVAMRGTLARLAKSQSRLASGRRIESPADDPAGHAAAVRLQARVTAVLEWQRQAEQARATLTANDALLERLHVVLGRAEELAVSGANGANDAAERAAMGVEVDGLLEETADIANTTNDGRYLLGGRETLTAPLTISRNAAGEVTSALWNPRGVDAAVELEIAEGVTIQTNVGGTSVLGADTDLTFLPSVLVALRDALAANDGDAVRSVMDDLKAAEDRLATPIADTGVRLNQVDHTREDLDAQHLAARAALSAVLDADIARVATEFSQQELAYRASLHAAAKAIQPSLLEFLG